MIDLFFDGIYWQWLGLIKMVNLMVVCQDDGFMVGGFI